jgi:protoporphyrinogen IX oxidase
VSFNYFYNVFKTVHVIGIICWMAGILYLYRLFIYHFDFGKTSPPVHQLLSLMEKRLLKYITIPAMIVSVFTGLSMVFLNPLLLNAGWFQLKLLAVIMMIAMTLYCIFLMSKLKARTLKGYTSLKLRILNEIPTVLMILIVVLVILRPF